MSSRSLAAARSRRAGDNIPPPPVSGNRPVTSIGSQAAFVQQQMPQNYQQNMGQPSPNVRVARGQAPPQQFQQQQFQQQQFQQQQLKQQIHQQSATNNSLPFSKISISDAVGLITLRLGRVEQWIIETDHEQEFTSNINNNNDNSSSRNSTTIDTSVLTSIFNRLDNIENIENKPNSSEEITKLSEEATKLREQLIRIGDEGIKHNLAIAKHTEQLFKFERELVETKDILKTFMIKYDLFTNETNEKFTDFETALTELEKSVLLPEDKNVNIEQNEQNDYNLNDANDTNENESESNIIMSVDLKNIIKQELASSS